MMREEYLRLRGIKNNYDNKILDLIERIAFADDEDVKRKLCAYKIELEGIRSKIVSDMVRIGR